MKLVIKSIMYLLFAIFVILLVGIIINMFYKIAFISDNIEAIKDIIIPMACSCIPIFASYYFEDKINTNNLNKSLEILERHRKNNSIDEFGNKIEDGTVTPGFSNEYNFIVNNWNKSSKEILESAKKQDFLQKKVEGPENRVKNHFLGKKF